MIREPSRDYIDQEVSDEMIYTPESHSWSNDRSVIKSEIRIIVPLVIFIITCMIREAFSYIIL